MGKALFPLSNCFTNVILAWKDVDNLMISKEKIKIELDEIARMLTSLSHDDIPGLGKILNSLELFEKNLEEEGFDDILDVSLRIRRYIEAIVLEEQRDLEPIKEGYLLVKAMVRYLTKGKLFTFDTEEVLSMLNPQPDSSSSPASVEVKAETAPKDNPPPDVRIKPVKSPSVRALEQDDIDILGDFIIESRENLETIEVNLIELEENPDDTEIINTIFRPFHTIKGISGFLGLNKLNALSHGTENLLDSARKGKFTIDNEITDLILQSVDMLKHLIDRVEKGLEVGMTADDHDIEIDSLVARIETMDRSQNSTESALKVGEILVKKGALEENAVNEALKEQHDNPDKKLGTLNND